MGKNIFFDEALEDKFFQIFPEASAVDGLVLFIAMEGAVLFLSGKRMVVPDRLRAIYLRRSLIALKTLLMGSFR